MLLFGSALVFGATGELGFAQIADATRAQDLVDDPLLVAGLAMIIAGLCFKASAAPFHQWTPDVYEGAPTPVTAFMAAATKTVAVVLMLRVLVTAFPQEDGALDDRNRRDRLHLARVGEPRRPRAAKRQAHAGVFVDCTRGLPADRRVLGQRAGRPRAALLPDPYAAASLGAFGVIAARERELGAPVTLDNLAGLGWERPMIGVAMWAFMLSFAGLPPTGGFVGKFYVSRPAYERGWMWPVIVGVIGTLISLYYYLAVIRALHMRSPLEMQLAPTGGSPPREFLLGTSVFVAMAVTIGSFIFVGPLIDLAQNAAESLRSRPVPIRRTSSSPTSRRAASRSHARPRASPRRRRGRGGTRGEAARVHRRERVFRPARHAHGTSGRFLREGQTHAADVREQ